jgi:molecular chaperone DnaJ
MDPYDELGIPAGSSFRDVKKAHRALVRRFHPDYNPSPEARDRFSAVQRAYETIREREGSALEVSITLPFGYPTSFATTMKHSEPHAARDLLIRDQALFSFYL